jgi:hypothetical protein
LPSSSTGTRARGRATNPTSLARRRADDEPSWPWGR